MKTGNFNKSNFTLLNKGLRFFYLIAVVFCFSAIAATAQDGSRNLSVSLWGTRNLNTPPMISGISKNNLPQAGRLKITGTNFGNAQGTSTVRINGAIAPVSNWSETAITAYVSDASTIGAGGVEVITVGGTSNSQPLTVTARPPANGRVQWRVEVDGIYINGRPATGADGTIYTALRGHLYAIEPDGGVKWIFNVPNVFNFVQNAVDVGADGTIYFATTFDIYAVNPNGTLKWQISDPAASRTEAGPNVGGDGNIYVVTNDRGSAGGFGFTVISPAGQILRTRSGYVESNNPGLLNDRQIVFGPQNQLYFSLNYIDGVNYGLQFFELGGNFRFARNPASIAHNPAVAPDGTIYVVRDGGSDFGRGLSAYDTNGNLIRTFPDLAGNTNLTSPDVGADGTIYIGRDYNTLAAYNPDGTQRWQLATPTGFTRRDPAVNPQNTAVVLGGAGISPEPGFVLGASSTGQSSWTIILPEENGGFIRPSARPRFSPDGLTAYVGMSFSSSSADEYTYLYAISASPTLPCSFTISPNSVSYQYNGSSGNIALTATNSNCPWTAASNVNWITVYNTNGIGDGTVTYTVTANPNFTPRTGTITVGGQTFTVTQGARTTATQVSITSPASGEVFTLPTNIFVSANATNPNGTINRVEFYANNELIGTDTSAPYQIVWNDPSATDYTLIAKSIDQNGAVTLSEPVTITIFPVPPPEPAPLPIPPPTLTSPTANQIFQAGEAITFNAQPGSSQYPVVRVEFYLDTTLIGSDDTAPYSFTLNNAPGGIYSVSARTVANTGAQATSQPIDIRVNADRANTNATLFDFDGDGKADISVFRPSNGAWYISRSTNGFTGILFGFGTDKIVPADYDGDGKADVAVFRDGNWYYLKSSNGTFAGLQWGLSTDIPIPADFDGDGKADINVFRPSDGGWYRLNSSTGAFVGLNFGQNGDKPLIADFDGDGKNDIAVFRPSTGAFYSLDSATGNFRGVAFGFGTDIPTMGDFDGDGKTDIAVFRPSNGAWYRLNSSTGAFYGTLFGQNGDIPTAADYDGDGKTDIAVFRNGDWYYLRSTNGAFVGQTFGFGTDKPLPAAF